MFLGAMVLVAVGAALMAAYSATFGFVIGLFTVMGGIFLWAIALNYGPPPASHPLPSSAHPPHESGTHAAEPGRPDAPVLTQTP
jgi:hypothetical protein